MLLAGGPTNAILDINGPNHFGSSVSLLKCFLFFLFFASLLRFVEAGPHRKAALKSSLYAKKWRAPLGTGVRKIRDVNK